MKIDCKDYRVREGDNVHLEKWPTKATPKDYRSMVFFLGAML